MAIIQLVFDKVGTGTKQITLSEALNLAAQGKIKSEPGKLYLQSGNDLLKVETAIVPVIIP